MKIAILGSGGREHAIAASISKSSKIENIYCIPGNAGTLKIAINIDLDINNFEVMSVQANTYRNNATNMHQLYLLKYELTKL